MDRKMLYGVRPVSPKAAWHLETSDEELRQIRKEGRRYFLVQAFLVLVMAWGATMVLTA